MEISLWLQLAGICIAGAISPGPSFLLVSNNTLSRGIVHGIFTSVTHGCGIFIWAIFTVGGVSIFILALSFGIHLLETLGIVVLIYIGFRMLCDGGNFETNIPVNPLKNISLKVSCLEGFLMALFNPKIPVFFLGIFSQFVSEDATFFQMTVMVFTATSIDILWYIILSMVMYRLSWNKSIINNLSLAQKVSGIILILAGIIFGFRLF